ncbi:hypothetical protein GE061_002563 [Apolygus lucorum]|uniref:Nuclear condensin complex subunit 3 C-terminal domain-containing protein n=1 Tax=Apolygus lucorum TaxID=248454 RepID=A0A8S9X5J4_APOLU|nr:hypothetical protein GE061_002563 [Apolygus lucorum]
MNECILEHSPVLGVNNIFNGAQHDANSHHRLRKELAEIYQQNPSADFIMEFMQCLCCCLIVQEKHPNVERALDFSAVFLAQHYQDMEEVLVAVFEFIFKNHSCKTQAVRFRCCEFMNRLLHNMDDQAVLYDDIYEKITSTMLERLQDKVPTIRAQAVMALQRLQVPTDSNCPIMKAFLYHMERDPSPDVRAKVIKHVAVTPRVLPILFERIYDVKSSVRKEAFKALSRLRVVKLSIKQRQKICTAGLADKSEPVKSFVLSNMMFTWYKQCDCNYITFLKVLFVETMDEDILEVLLFHLFKKQPSSSLFETVSGLLNKERVLPIKDLTPENVTLWLYAVKYQSKPQDGEDMDKDMVAGMVPELTKFSKYLKDFSLTLKKGDREKEFIAIQLFKLAATYSFDDEMGREQMRMMSINYLMDENVGKGAIPAIVRTFEQLVPSVKDRLMMMAEIISDIREPLMPSQSSAEDGVAEVENQMALLSCSSLDTDRVQKTDSETLVKCLTLIIQVFKAKDVTKIDATLLSLKDHFIFECFNSPSIEVQCLAQDVMAFFCIWSLDIAKENFLKFCFQLSNEGTCYSALGGVIDILLVHGFHPFSLNSPAASKPKTGAVSLNDLSNDPTLTPSQVFLVSLIVDLLDSETPSIRARACQGLAKLMVSGHLSSSLILARLILIWFSPSSASEPEIRQPLGIFLNMFSTKRPLAGEIILNSIMPALKATVDIETNDEEEIDPLAVAKLLVGSYHLQLAAKVSKELLIVNSYDPLVLSKILQMLEFQPQDSYCCANLLLLVCRGIKKMGKFWDKRVLKSMQNLKVKLEMMKQTEKNSSMNSTTRNKETSVFTSTAIIEEEGSMSCQDVSQSYSRKLPASSKVDDSVSSELPEDRTSTSANMVVDETADGNEEISAILPDSVVAGNVVDETALSDDEATGSDGEVISAPTKGNVIPDSDEESCEEDTKGNLQASSITGTNNVISSTDEDEEEVVDEKEKTNKKQRKIPDIHVELPTPPQINTRARSAKNNSSMATLAVPLRQTRATRKRPLT